MLLLVGERRAKPKDEATHVEALIRLAASRGFDSRRLHMIHLDAKWLVNRKIEYIPVNEPLFLRYNDENSPVECIVTYHANTEEEAERFLKSATALHVYENPCVYYENGKSLMLDGKFYEKPGYYLRCWCFELRGDLHKTFNEEIDFPRNKVA